MAVVSRLEVFEQFRREPYKLNHTLTHIYIIGAAKHIENFDTWHPTQEGREALP